MAIPPEQVSGLVTALVKAGFRTRHDPPLRMIDGQGIVQFAFQPAEAIP